MLLSAFTLSSGWGLRLAYVVISAVAKIILAQKGGIGDERVSIK